MNAERVSKELIAEYFAMPFMDLIFKAQEVHRKHHDPLKVQLSTLLSIKTGACVEDCAYCSQSARHKTGLKAEPLMEEDKILENARRARLNGATRYCMGASWKNVPEKEMPKLKRIIQGVKDLGLEACMTLGCVTKEQADGFKEVGLDYYNHNLDTSREYYKEIVTTRTYDDRLRTLQNIRDAGIQVCCGGIMGMGESLEDRIGWVWELANMKTPPESIPVNNLVIIPGTALAERSIDKIDNFDFIKTIAVVRILLPKCKLRLAAGREQMSEEMQALCFMAGASSIFFGNRLLTTDNPHCDKDLKMLEKLGITPINTEHDAEQCAHA